MKRGEPDREGDYRNRSSPLSVRSSEGAVWKNEVGEKEESLIFLTDRPKCMMGML